MNMKCFVWSSRACCTAPRLCSRSRAPAVQRTALHCTAASLHAGGAETTEKPRLLDCGVTQQAALAARLAAEYGVHFAATVGSGVHGRGLLYADRPAWNSSGTLMVHPQPQQPHPEALIRVPLDLVLSCYIPGCSPAAVCAPELQPLLRSSYPWEIQLGGMLAWASQCAAGSGRLGMFWSEYRQGLIPSGEQQMSLLLWSKDELNELQDAELVSTAAAWRQQVQDAFHDHIQPWTGSTSAALNDYVAAVGAVESRAYGIKDGGQELQAMVPFLCLANHSPTSSCTHGVNSAAGVYELHSGAGQHHTNGEEVLVSYGNKSNRQLMEQYGFVLPGNTMDRVCFGTLKQHQLMGRMSRDLIRTAAATLKDRPGCSEVVARRLDCAAASIVKSAGWRNMEEFRHVTRASSKALAVAMLTWSSAQHWPTSTQQDDALRAPAASAAFTLPDPAPCANHAKQPVLNARSRAAIEYRLQRKLLLGAVQDVLVEVLRQLDTGGVMSPREAMP